jgi:hypothetical protein
VAGYSSDPVLRNFLTGDYSRYRIPNTDIKCSVAPINRMYQSAISFLDSVAADRRSEEFWAVFRRYSDAVPSDTSEGNIERWIWRAGYGYIRLNPE